jgi:hypothetical protein
VSRPAHIVDPRYPRSPEELEAMKAVKRTARMAADWFEAARYACRAYINASGADYEIVLLKRVRLANRAYENALKDYAEARSRLTAVRKGTAKPRPRGIAKFFSWGAL